MTTFSDYIVYVDESGDHSLTSIDPNFPVFALSFCVVLKTDYITKVVPSVQNLKFSYWGHDAVVLHEYDIRKSTGDFTFLLTNQARREEFLADLHQVIVNAPFILIGSVIKKKTLMSRYVYPDNPYRLALQFCLERLYRFLRNKGQENRKVHIVFERRGKVEDEELELAFHRIVNGEADWGYRTEKFDTMEFEPVFAKKSVNSAGLQLADLTARPIALKVLRPRQPNRTHEVIQTKLGEIKTFP